MLKQYGNEIMIMIIIIFMENSDAKFSLRKVKITGKVIRSYYSLWYGRGMWLFFTTVSMTNGKSI